MQPALAAELLVAEDEERIASALISTAATAASQGAPSRGCSSVERRSKSGLETRSATAKSASAAAS